MDTQGLLPPPVKQRRRRHSSELKEQVLAACRLPGASVAAVPQQFNINANLIHKWRRAAEPVSAKARGDFVKVPLTVSPNSGISAPTSSPRSNSKPISHHWWSPIPSRR
ncbi:transposase [Spongiibacter sp. KMU-166]|uniref:Transposase n=1 Tax=Spongiibacter thalassae TaxID=2721624 RepID=A0ABX1GJJ7_9GAMM|nr:transposase [Spongiibacter thalassae]